MEAECLVEERNRIHVRVLLGAEAGNCAAMTSADAVDTYSLCGVQLAAVTPAKAAAVLAEAASRGDSVEAHLCNAYTLSLVDKDARLAAALHRAHLNLPDGTPVAWFGPSGAMSGPVRGPGLVRDVAAAGVQLGVRHYFYGGASGVAADLSQRLRRDVPGLVVAGEESPPFGDPTAEELDAAADRMNAAKADIVWVGLGTPRQDYVVPMIADRVTAVIVPVGAAFDFLTGRVKEAPKLLHGSGLEWMYRLASEPRRLWSRYLIGNPRFLMAVLRHRARQGPR